MIYVAEPLSFPQTTVYSLQQLQFIALCCIPFTACSNCSLLHYAVSPLQPTATAVYSIMLYSLYSLQQLQFIALCCIPFTAYNNCSLLHYAVFPLQPTATAVYCIMLYSLYSLQQLQFIALCCIPFTACSNCNLFHYAVFLHIFYCHSQINDNIVNFENSTTVCAQMIVFCVTAV